MNIEKKSISLTTGECNAAGMCLSTCSLKSMRMNNKLFHRFARCVLATSFIHIQCHNKLVMKQIDSSNCGVYVFFFSYSPVSFCVQLSLVVWVFRQNVHLYCVNLRTFEFINSLQTEILELRYSYEVVYWVHLRNSRWERLTHNKLNI